MRRNLVAMLCLGAVLGTGACSGGSSAPSVASDPAGPGGSSGSTRPTAPAHPPAVALYEAACAGKLDVKTTGTIKADSITELSGVAASRANKDVLWVENDSGNDPNLFAISTDGTLLGTFTPKGATNVDWEDIAIVPGASSTEPASIYLADIGDNAKARPEIVLYRVAEPKVTQGGTAEPKPDQVRTIDKVDTITLRYPDGSHNAEAFFVDPANGDAVVITKEESGPASVYVAKASELIADANVTLEQAGTVSFGEPSLATQVTGADISPAGDVIAVRTYGGVHLFKRTPDQTVGQALSGKACDGPPLPNELQGEAVGFASDGKSYFTAAEGKKTELHQTKPG